MTSLIASIAAGLALLTAVAPATAQNVTINIGQPGFYGRIDIGDFGPPPVYGQPIIVREARYGAEPVYLRVPPGHRKNWSKHCSRYNACARPVMFVRDDWYTNTYAPRYRARHDGYRAERQQVEYREYDHDDDQGNKKHKKYKEYKEYKKHDKHEDRHDKHGGGKGHGRGH